MIFLILKNIIKYILEKRMKEYRKSYFGNTVYYEEKWGRFSENF